MKGDSIINRVVRGILWITIMLSLISAGLLLAEHFGIFHLEPILIIRKDLLKV